MSTVLAPMRGANLSRPYRPVLLPNAMVALAGLVAGLPTANLKRAGDGLGAAMALLPDSAGRFGMPTRSVCRALSASARTIAGRQRCLRPFEQA
jgi:hypothetical protein